MIFRFALAFVVFIGLTGCASIHTGKPGPAQKNPALESRLLDADQALDRLNLEIREFYSDVEKTRRDVQQLYQRPGWPEMAKIIERIPSEEGVPNNPLCEMTGDETAERWTLKYGVPWQTVFTEYLQLVKRCSALEARRISLQSRLLAVEGKFLGAAVLAYSDGREAEGKAIDDVVNLLGRSSEELESYTVNAIGLY